MKKSKMLRITSLFLCLTMCLVVFSSFSVASKIANANENSASSTRVEALALSNSGGDLTRLNVPKTEYEYTEPINISAIGTGKDWVGIYKPEASASIYWTYIDVSQNKGVGSGVEFDIKKAANKNSGAPAELPAGNYIIRLMPNDSSNLSLAVAWVEVVIKQPTSSEAELPEKPLSVEYELKDKTSGYSEGKLTVKLAKDNPAKDIVCYWANNSGRLPEYTSLAKFKVTGETTVRQLPSHTLIPAGATKLHVYTSLNGMLSEEYYEVTLPKDAASKPLGFPLFEFQVVSDIHINEGNTHVHNKNYVNMLKDIVEVAPNSEGLFIVGDIADHGYAGEWENFVKLHASVEDAPKYYLTLGNHDLYNGGYESQINQFLKYTQLPEGGKAESCHYDFWLEGFHYVFLGNDAGPVGGSRTTLLPKTLEWLDKTLAEGRDENKPTFLFLHQSIYDTIAGSLPGQGWDGVVDHENLSAVLKKYPEVIMFNGHSHWVLDSEMCMYPKTEELPTIFNTASVAYLWTSYNIVEGEHADGSHGYYISVYEDKIVVQGRDFTNKEWISSAQFVVEYGVKEEKKTGCSSSTQALAFTMALCTLFGAGIIIKKR